MNRGDGLRRRRRIMWYELSSRVQDSSYVQSLAEDSETDNDKGYLSPEGNREVITTGRLEDMGEGE